MNGEGAILSTSSSKGGKPYVSNRRSSTSFAVMNPLPSLSHLSKLALNSSSEKTLSPKDLSFEVTIYLKH